jgi:tyrosine-specific transport protein
MMTISALCLVEVGFWMKKEDAHIMTMASTILGQWGRKVVWALFLFICYASLVAYIAGCGHLAEAACSSLLGISISKATGCWLFVALFGPFLLGPRYILGRANDLLFVLMVIAYFVIIWKGISVIQPDLLWRHDWPKAYSGIPLLITAFSFQTMVPSLHPFLDHDRRSLRVAIVIGTSIAFCVYALWQLVILGSIPLEGDWGLLHALREGVPATYCLVQRVHSVLIPEAAAVFSLFALVTSFFGIGMGLYDFLSDGLSIPKRGHGVVILGALVLLPSLFFALTWEKVFITALDISGGFGDTIMNGMIPIILLWVGSMTFAPKVLRSGIFRKSVLVLLLLLFATAFAAEARIRFFHESKEIEKPIDEDAMQELPR